MGSDKPQQSELFTGKCCAVLTAYKPFANETWIQKTKCDLIAQGRWTVNVGRDSLFIALSVRVIIWQYTVVLTVQVYDGVDSSQLLLRQR